MSQALQPAEAGERNPSSWASRLPADLRPLGGSGRSFSGRLPDGVPVAVKAVPVGSEQEGGRMLEYLRRLAGYRDPTLVPILGAEQRQGAVWVMSELDEGLPLGELIGRSQLSPSQVVSVGLDVLAGLQSLQQLGLGHGNLHAGNVQVSPQGRARLTDYALRPRFRAESGRLGWPDPRVDLRAAGALLCGALGVAPRSQGSELYPAERSVPALVAAVRVMAEGGAGRFAGAALGLFEEASGTRARPAQLERSRQELGALVRKEQPPAAPAVPAASAVPAAPAVPTAPLGAVSPAPAPPPAPASPTSAVGPASAGQSAGRTRPAAAAAGERLAGPPRSRHRSLRWLFLAAALSLLLLTLGLVGAWLFLRPAAAPAQARSASTPGQAQPASSSGQQAAAPSAQPSAAPAATPTQPAGQAGDTATSQSPAPAEAAVPAPAEGAPQPEAAAPAPAAASAAGADSPTGAVSAFYDRVGSHDFGGALALWSASMQSAYPPAENINSRFSNTSSITMRRDDLVSAGGGRAVVAVDVVEVRGGQTYHWIGNWYLVQSGNGWLLDRPGLRPA